MQINSSVQVLTSISDSVKKEIIDYLTVNNFSVYHHPLYLQVLSDETGMDYYYLIYRNNKKKIEGVLPLLTTRGIVFKNSPLSNKRISSLPRTPFAGPAANNDIIIKYLLEEAKKLTGNDDILVQIKSKNNLHDYDSTFFPTLWRKTYIKLIPPEGQKFNFEDKNSINRAIKRAEKNSVKIKKCESRKELKLWFKLYLDVMRQHGIPPRSLRFFELLWDVLFPAGLLDINFAVVRLNGRDRIINGNVNFQFNKKYFGGFKAGDMKMTNYMGGDYLLYNEMLALQEKGFLSYDLGEAPSGNVSLTRYKTKWGTENEQIYHNYYGNIRSDELSSLELSSDNGFLKKVWQKLPLKVIEKAGKYINYRL